MTARRSRPRGPVELDGFDRRVLAAVQRDNIAPLRQIAEEVCLSAAAVARRLQRLRRDGVIAADVSIVDPVAAGVPITVIVEVSVESEIVENLDRVRARFVACPQVQHCYYVTGEVDFILIMAVANMDQYETLTRKLFFDGGNVSRFRSFVAMQRVKVTSALALTDIGEDYRDGASDAR